MIVIVDYGIGNLGSILNMLKKVGAPAVISRSAADISKATKLILPGVGAFDTAARKLNECNLIPVLKERVFEHAVPILGLCVGFQLMTRSSEEGKCSGLGWFPAKTVRFHATDNQTEIKVPHMGWNAVTPTKNSRLFDGLENRARFYFVHSYHVVADDRTAVAATTEYGYRFDSAMESRNIAGVQFHPEKSHTFGMKMFKNFTERF